MFSLGFRNFSDRTNSTLQKKQAMLGAEQPQMQAPGQAVMNVNRFTGGADDLSDANPIAPGMRLAMSAANSPPPMPSRPLATSGAPGVPNMGHVSQFSAMRGMQPRPIPATPDMSIMPLPQQAPMQMPLGGSDRVAPPFWSTAQGEQYAQQQEREGMRRTLMDRVMAGMQPTQSGAQAVDQRLQQKPLGVGGRIKEGVLGFLQGFGRGGLLGGLGGAIGGATGDNYRQREAAKIDQQNAITRQQSQDAATVLGRLDIDEYRDSQIAKGLSEQARREEELRTVKQPVAAARVGDLGASKEYKISRTENERGRYGHDKEMLGLRNDQMNLNREDTQKHLNDMFSQQAKQRILEIDTRYNRAEQLKKTPSVKASGGTGKRGGSGRVNPKDPDAPTDKQIKAETTESSISKAAQANIQSNAEKYAQRILEKQDVQIYADPNNPSKGTITVKAGTDPNSPEGKRAAQKIKNDIKNRGEKSPYYQQQLDIARSDAIAGAPDRARSANKRFREAKEAANKPKPGKGLDAAEQTSFSSGFGKRK